MLAFVYLDTQKVYSEQQPAMYTWIACEGSKEKVSAKTHNLASYGVHISYIICLDVFPED